MLATKLQTDLIEFNRWHKDKLHDGYSIYEVYYAGCVIAVRAMHDIEADQADRNGVKLAEVALT